MTQVAVKPSDILLYAGGRALARFGQFVRQTTSIGRATIAGTFTHTRTTTATYHDRNGRLLTAAIDTPRPHWIDTDADGVLDAPVLLLERSATNLLLQSESLDNAAWTKTRSTITADATTGPDGASNADALVEDATASNTHLVSQTITITANETVALSVYAKANTRSWIALSLVNGANNVIQYFDLTTGVKGSSSVAGTGVFVRSRIEPVGNGWYRCILTGQVGGGLTSMDCQVLLATGDSGASYSGDGTSSAYVTALQAEDLFATSYIATTTAQVSRGFDLFSMPFYAEMPQELTLYAKFLEMGSIVDTALFGRPIQVGGQANDPSNIRMLVNSSGQYEMSHRDATSAVTSVASPAPAIGDTVELLGAFHGAGDGSVQLTQVVNGGTATVASQSAAKTVGAFDDIVAYIGSSTSGGNVCTIGVIAAIVVRGTGYTVDQLRELL